MNQLSFLDIKSPPSSNVHRLSLSTGEALRDKGIQKAVQHAEDVYNDWQKKALDFLYLYAREHRRFSAEMVRIEAKGIVEEPPCLRAWGGIMMIGSKRRWIRQIGYVHVVNPKAHKANAAFWESMLCL